jgi:DNA repair exonuclease SbcCD ATPase subunit
VWKTKSEHDALEFEEQVKALEDELEREKEKVKKMQFELAQKMQELHTVKDQQNQATNGLKEQVKERDAQIAKLKRQITVKGMTSLVPALCELCVCVVSCVLCVRVRVAHSSPNLNSGIQSQSSSQAELESSLSAMTDRLIRLQALNETLTNEKAALQMRLNSEVQVRLARVFFFFFCG